MEKIYLDNAATTYPKPQAVQEAMCSYFNKIGVSPGRGGYMLALEADRQILKGREAVARFFNCQETAKVVFTLNITYAINFVLKGVLKPGDHVITTGLEHNSVARPLHSLKNSGVISYTVIKADKYGFVNPEDISKAVNTNTRMIVLNHASNVFGTIQNAEEVGKIAHEHGLLYLLDTAQTAGSIPIDMQKCGASFLTFTGHKGLYGPPGVGGVCIDEQAAGCIEPLILGGTGSRSHILAQPDFFPDRLESGTPNTPGIMGLAAGIEFVQNTGIDKIREHELKLLRTFVEGCRELPQIQVYGANILERQTPCVSINIKEMDGGQLSFVLDSVYGIMTRSGLHCAPLAHENMGTFPEGTVRFSFGWFNTEAEVNYTLKALKEIIEES